MTPNRDIEIEICRCSWRCTDCQLINAFKFVREYSSNDSPNRDIEIEICRGSWRCTDCEFINACKFVMILKLEK